MTNYGNFKRITKISIKNFQVIDSLEIEPGFITTIIGDNGKMKTSILNAIMWALFNRAVTNESGFNPKPIDELGEVHHLTTSVVLEIECTTGGILTLERTMFEKWTVRTKKFDKNDYGYFIDNESVGSQDYFEFITKRAGGTIERAQSAMIPEFFSSDLSAIERRRELMLLVDKTTIGDILQAAKDERYKGLIEYLGIPEDSDLSAVYDIEDWIQTAERNRKNTQKELDTIPTRIDEARMAIPTYVYDQPLSLEQVNETLQQNNVELGAVERQRDELLRNNESDNALDNEILKAERDVLEFINRHNKAISDATEDTTHKMHGAVKAMSETQASIAQYEREINSLQAEIRCLTQQRKDLLMQYNNTKGQEWNTSNNICPSCNRELPATEIEAHVLQFTNDKKRKLADINKKGKLCSQALIDEKQALLEERTKSKNFMLEALDVQQNLISECKQAIEKATKPVEDDVDYIRLKKQLDTLKAQQSEKAKSVKATSAEINLKISELKSTISQLQKLQQDFMYAHKQKTRISELENDMDKKEKALQRLIEGITLARQFARDLLERKVNDRFKSIRFRLFELNTSKSALNEYKDICEVLVLGDRGQLIPYRIANRAARINCGIEVIEALTEAWGFSLPILIDNAESVTKRKRTDRQVFSTHVIPTAPLIIEPVPIEEMDLLEYYEAYFKQLEFEKSQRISFFQGSFQNDIFDGDCDDIVFEEDEVLVPTF
ncbi:hypothetical protein LJB89_02865 [Tyzzerella sp. OttesenSCG-928-J15]|nr:hypothetical protein [Tyzzerella sp. OttesenSCG-928-J15]